jgi:allantoinase
MSAPAPDLLFLSERICRRGAIEPGAVLVRAGRIVAVGRPTTVYAASQGAVETIDVGSSVLLPGLVDPHVHVNEPGRTEWEGFETATRAAAAGGITTLVDMPLNSTPVTTNVRALEAKLAAARRAARVDCAFWGGVVPGNAAELEALAQSGVRGFKCFLVHSGIDDFPNAREEDLREAMPVLARLGLPLLVHAELPGPIEAARRSGPIRAYADYLATRPRAAEHEAIALVLRLARETGCAVHIVHLASADELELLRAARHEGLPITVETCTHYLAFCSEEIADGATAWKCAPPIRERENRERLWAALVAGEIDFVASDHSPCPPGMKCMEDGDFARAWGGIASLELTLPVLWTEARARRVPLSRLAEWLAAAPACLPGLDGRKGAIEVGCDADLVVFDPDATWRVEAEKLQHRHKITPYAGRTLSGRVEMTFLRGRKIYDRGEFPGEAAGEMLLRESVPT